MQLINLLDKTATVTHISGGVPAVGSPIACTIAPADWRTVAEYAQQGVTAVYVIYSAVDLGAVAGDHVSVGGKAYPVVGVRSFSNAIVGTAVFVTVCGAPA
jgi:hypothetical protein